MLHYVKEKKRNETVHFSHLQYYKFYFHSVSVTLFLYCSYLLKLLYIYLLSIFVSVYFILFYLCLSPQRTSAMQTWVQFSSAFLLTIVIYSLESITWNL